jgi:hypothetical protein
MIPTTLGLYFPSGNFWQMGCVSAGTEQDSGLRHSTLTDPSGKWKKTTADVFGNLHSALTPAFRATRGHKEGD